MRRSTELNCLGEFGKREWGWEGGEKMGLWAENARTVGEEWGWGVKPRAGRKVGEGRGKD